FGRLNDTDRLAERAASRPVALRERSAHDRDRLAALSVVIVERSSFQYLDASGREVLGSGDSKVRLGHLFGRRRRSIEQRDIGRRQQPTQWQERNRSSRLDVMDRAKAIAYRLEESRQSLPVSIRAWRQRQLKRERMAGREAGLDAFEPRKA